MRKPMTIGMAQDVLVPAADDVQVTAPNDIREYKLVAEPEETKARYRARQRLFSKILDRGGY